MVFQAIGIDCICKNFSTNEKQIEVIDQINKMMLETAYTQYLDDQIIDTEATYWRAARAKSCPFFELAFYMGAIASGASLDTAEAILKLGRLYGEMVQVHDDLSDSFADHCGSDWLQRKSTLPILFARVVNHPEQMRFMTLLENITNLDQVREARGILLRCGAVSYCLNEIVQRDKIGKQFLADLNLPNSEPLDQVFDHILMPIWKLLKINLEIS